MLTVLSYLLLGLGLITIVIAFSNGMFPLVGSGICFFISGLLLSTAKVWVNTNHFTGVQGHFEIQKVNVIGCIVFVAIGVLIIVCYISSANKLAGKMKKAENMVTYDEKDNILTLKSCGPELATIITIENNMNIDTKYKPETLHIGSATVGGVTTGGAYTTGGYNYVSGMRKTGTARLKYRDKLIKKIKVEDSILQNKSINSISHRFKDGIITVVEDVKLSKEERAISMAILDRGGVCGDILYKGYPTREECERIRNWMITK